jgi:polyisoprenoid-binding protein YceI
MELTCCFSQLCFVTKLKFSKMKKITLIFIFPILFCAFKNRTSTNWKIDSSHTKAEFSVSRLMAFHVEGYFKQVEATVVSTRDDFSDAVIEVTAQMSSFFTDNSQINDQLAHAGFFEAERFPTMSFKSTSISKIGENEYVLTGNFTIHGITKPVTFNVTSKIFENQLTKKTNANFKIVGKIDRKDFNIGLKIPSALLGDTVDINIDTEFIKE